MKFEIDMSSFLLGIITALIAFLLIGFGLNNGVFEVKMLDGTSIYFDLKDGARYQVK